MSLILVQIGQCGIQVGQSLSDALEKEYYSVINIRNVSHDHLNYPLNLFKQLAIDTEAKV
jgi:hypothetical protein